MIPSELGVTKYHIAAEKAPEIRVVSDEISFG
jgi:hypothetical protein